MAECAEPAGTVGFFLCRAGQHLRAAAIPNPRLEARMLLAHAMGTDTLGLLRASRDAVPPAAVESFMALLQRRLQSEPVAHLLGEREFWSLSFEVSPATLIPRPDSETLIELALDSLPKPQAVRRVLDLGTGTGCLLLAALSELPQAFGVGVDRVPEAAALAARNAARLGLADRAAFLVGDWDAPLQVQGRADTAAPGGVVPGAVVPGALGFGLILSNPPYIESAVVPALDPEVARYEPASALDGGAGGLDAYARIAAALPGLLAPGGIAILELGAGQQAAVEGLAQAAGLIAGECRADLAGIPRALLLRST